MKRREFLTVCGAGVTAGYANTGSVEGAVATGGQFEAPGAGTQRLVLRPVGMNALLVTSVDGQETSADIVGLDSDGLALPDGTKMHPHSPLLVIATANLVDQNGGTEALLPHLQKWRLRTSTTKFRFWDLSKKKWSLENVTGPDLSVGVYGAVPLKALNSGYTTVKWRTKAAASAKLELTKGLITDDVPRYYGSSKAQRRRWRFTTGDFNSVKDTPVYMTDTLRVELTADITKPVAFKIDGVGTIATTGQWVEAYLVTVPHKLTDYEMAKYLRLYHIAAAYQLFDEVEEMRLPTSDTAGGGEEPVFCPPALFTEAN